MALKQPTISEIRSYQKPIKSVKKSYDGYLFALGWAWKPNSGYKKPNILLWINGNFKGWRSIQAFVEKLGKNSRKQKIGGFLPDSITTSKLELLKKRKFS